MPERRSCARQPFQSAILAAGAGMRLSSPGLPPKPLVEIGGQPMIVRLARILTEGAPAGMMLSVIIRPGDDDVAQALRHGLADRDIDLRTVALATPGPVASLAALSDIIDTSVPTALTTVDTVFSAAAWQHLTDTARPLAGRAFVTGTTAFVDDEKPLYVSLEESRGACRRISAFADAPTEARQHVSAGVYILPPAAWSVLRRCVASGATRMRMFQRALLDEMPAYGVDMGKVVDVDRPSDLEAARALAALDM